MNNNHLYYLITISDCAKQYDLVFILDRSGSVETRFALHIALVKRVINGLDFAFGRTRIGMILYDNKAEVAFDLTKYETKQQILNAIAFNLRGGKTNTAAALRMARTKIFGQTGDRNGVPNVEVILTDGQDNVEVGSAATEARLSANENIEMFVVGVGNNVNIPEINKIASDPDSTHAFTSMRNEQEVASVADKILNSLCS